MSFFCFGTFDKDLQGPSKLITVNEDSKTNRKDACVRSIGPAEVESVVCQISAAACLAANFAEKYSIKWESGSGWQFISFLAKSQISKLQIATSFASADLLSIPFTNCWIDNCSTERTQVKRLDLVLISANKEQYLQSFCSRKRQKYPEHIRILKAAELNKKSVRN